VLLAVISLPIDSLLLALYIVIHCIGKRELQLPLMLCWCVCVCLPDILMRIVAVHCELWGYGTIIHGIRAVGFRYVHHFNWFCTKMQIWKTKQCGKL